MLHFVQHDIVFRGIMTPNEARFSLLERKASLIQYVTPIT
jgi:hypothetical protein